MCGIAGFISPSCRSIADGQVIRKMTDAIARRGPDADGAWSDAEAGVVLGHRRLSILDLTPAGSQPMISAGGRYVITFNGEIYNYRAIRKVLEDGGSLTASWRGHSDTELMLAAFESWGVKKAVGEFIGMFAFALWDRKERLLYLVRDRIGEKPLYYGWMGQTFLFGSDLKALTAHPDFHAEVNRDALALLMRHSYIPAPHCIYRGLSKLEPGMILTFSSKGAKEGDTPSFESYWRAQDVAEQGIAAPFCGDEEEAVSCLDDLLRDAVAMQMAADVPLGAFLSGGIDSSLIVALMQTQSAIPVKTFTIGFHEQDYNEAIYAKAVAHHLGTEHTEFIVTPGDALRVIPDLPAVFSEPFSDSSQIPTLLLAGLTRNHVTVSLSGDAGDELFGGYTRYLLAHDLWHTICRLPKGIRQAAASVITALPANCLDFSFRWLTPTFIKYGRAGSASDKLRKLSEILPADSPEDLYGLLMSAGKDLPTVLRQPSKPLTALTDIRCRATGADFSQQMMYLDLISYLPDDILVKVDRCAMGVSLETRIPLLDHRVVEFAMRLPTHLKIRNGTGKWLLRRVLHRYLPGELIERPKMGFAVPIDAWLRGPLRDWAESLLGERRLREEGFFHVRPLREKWVDHLSGKANWQSLLWDVLMFQAWLDAKQLQCSLHGMQL